MDKKIFRTGLICGCIGSFLTLIGDILIGANPTAEISTGIDLVDAFADAIGNSDIRMVMGGMLGVFGIPITGIGYHGIYTLLKNEKGIMPVIYKISILVYIGLAGAGVHLACAVIPLLYKWISVENTQLAVQVAEKYAYYFMMPLTVIFGVLLLAAIVYQTIIIAKGKTAYPKKAVFYNMVFGVIVSYIVAVVAGNNVVGNGIATGAISIGHLWMFGMMLIKMPDKYKE